MRRILAALGVLVGSLGMTNTTAEAAPTYRVTHTGDSISAMAFGFVAGPGGQINVPGDVWRDLEHGRGAYKLGMAGRGSTWSQAKLAVARTMPGGWIVIQDNSIDAASDWEWTKLVTDIEALTPDDVCLLGVLPGYVAANDPNNGATYAATTARRATIMGQVFMRHPCRRFVFLNNYMAEFPEQFPDGQHPDVTARTWLRGQIIGGTR